jgi:hypothetical protein
VSSKRRKKQTASQTILTISYRDSFTFIFIEMIQIASCIPAAAFGRHFKAGMEQEAKF